MNCPVFVVEKANAFVKFLGCWEMSIVDQFSRQFGMSCLGAAHWCDTVIIFFDLLELVNMKFQAYQHPFSIESPYGLALKHCLGGKFATSPFSGSLDLFMFLSIKRKHNWNTWNTKWFNCTTWFSSRWQVFAVGKELFVVFALKWDAWKSCVRWTMRPWWNMRWYQVGCMYLWGARVFEMSCLDDVPMCFF